MKFLVLNRAHKRQQRQTKLFFDSTAMPKFAGILTYPLHTCLGTNGMAIKSTACFSGIAYALGDIKIDVANGPCNFKNSLLSCHSEAKIVLISNINNRYSVSIAYILLVYSVYHCG